jgi:hypothetical protein
MIKFNAGKKAGINNISHLIDNNGNIASEKFIKTKYTLKPKPLEYNSLVHCIPKNGKP